QRDKVEERHWQVGYPVKSQAHYLKAGLWTGQESGYVRSLQSKAKNALRFEPMPLRQQATRSDYLHINSGSIGRSGGKLTNRMESRILSFCCAGFAAGRRKYGDGKKVPDVASHDYQPCRVGSKI